MSDQGYILLDREIWDHDIFEPEPFTERLAWIWMISSAVWQNKRVRVGRKSYALQRGQLVFSTRFMAEKWGWSKSKVHRFLARLQSDKMINVKTDHEATHITLCNYNKYQLGGDTKRDTAGTLAGHSRDKEEEINTLRKDVVVVASGNLVTPEALHLSEKLLVIAGHDPKFWPPGWCGAPMRVQTWLNENWPPEIIVATVKGVMAKMRGPPPHSVNFFEKAIAAEIARQAAPLPTVEIRPAESITVHHGSSRPGQSLTDSIRRELAELERQEGTDPQVPTSPVLRIPD